MQNVHAHFPKDLCARERCEFKVTPCFQFLHSCPLAMISVLLYCVCASLCGICGFRLLVASCGLEMARCEVVSKVMQALDKLAPTKFAAKWDNVGLLIDAVQCTRTSFVLFFCNDLTPAVLDEAVRKDASLIVTYHPTPFVPQKQFHLTNIPARILLSCASKNIAVYSPHTSWDVAPSGLNEWLIQGIAAAVPRQIGSMTPVKKADDPTAAANGFGDGRVATFTECSTVADVVEAVKRHLALARVQLALPTSVQAAVATARATGGDAAVMRLARTLPADSVAVCAGSGSGVLPGVAASVYVTGEMGHHEVLAACHAGASVILTGHSNCERGYLSAFALKLQAVLEQPDEAASSMTSPLPPMQYVVSQVDCDPLFVV